MHPTSLTRTVSAVLGWSYFAVWSASFWPQALLNYRRRSVVGLSFDFQLVNILGYACYSFYSCCLAFDGGARRAYAAKFGRENLVTPADACFALHGFALTAAQIGQIVAYDRGAQRLSRITVTFVASVLGVTAAIAACVAVRPRFLPAAALDWLNVLYWLSLVKLVVTVVKYVSPRVFFFN